MQIQLGRFQTLEIVKEVEFGLYLDGGEQGEILLPSRYVPESWQIGEQLEVFIYLDNEERLVATTLVPAAQVGEFAWLEVAWVNQYGAFLDWGLMKDLFVPFREQKLKMQVGKSYMVYVYVDEESYRIVGSAKVERFLSADRPDYSPGDEVDIVVWQKTDLGFKVIINHRYSGMLYDSELFREMYPGWKGKAYVKQVREDGKIDLMADKPGMEKVTDFSEVLLRFIRSNGGEIPFTDKSPAGQVYETFGVSKKTFKKAVGDLYKRKEIVLLERGIGLSGLQ